MHVTFIDRQPIGILPVFFVVTLFLLSLGACGDDTPRASSGPPVYGDTDGDAEQDADQPDSDLVDGDRDAMVTDGDTNTEAPLDGDDTPTDGDSTISDGDSEQEQDRETPPLLDGDIDFEGERLPKGSCGLDYPFVYDSRKTARPPIARPDVAESDGPDRIVHPEPAPPGYWTTRVSRFKNNVASSQDIILPDYSDNMPLFERARDWYGDRRCYELPDYAIYLSEAEAYDLYHVLASATTGALWRSENGRRQVVGIRGAYPGTFAFHGNKANRFNDTLALLWIDENGDKRVKEFAVNTEPSHIDFGWHNSSHLRPNRAYSYVNGTHRNYNALAIAITGYKVRDETNKNGHWDSDRNGWWSPSSGEQDHDRAGSAHNIHMGSLNAPLWTAAVANWSAGCQVIPGMANWLEFIVHAWTGLGDPVTYYLVDVRDIDARAWGDCENEDGTLRCPYRVEAFPASVSGDLQQAAQSEMDSYNCAPTLDESGGEDVYLITVQTSGTLSVSIDDAPGDAVDPDIHILDGQSPDACLARANIELEIELSPGRYYIVVDTYVDEGQPLPGPYRMDIDFY